MNERLSGVLFGPLATLVAGLSGALISYIFAKRTERKKASGKISAEYENEFAKKQLEFFPRFIRHIDGGYFSVDDLDVMYENAFEFMPSQIRKEYKKVKKAIEEGEKADTTNIRALIIAFYNRLMPKELRYTDYTIDKNLMYTRQGHVLLRRDYATYIVITVLTIFDFAGIVSCLGLVGILMGKMINETILAMQQLPLANHAISSEVRWRDAMAFVFSSFAVTIFVGGLIIRLLRIPRFFYKRLLERSVAGDSETDSAYTFENGAFVIALLVLFGVVLWLSLGWFS